LSGGRLLAIYAKHGSERFFRYRFTTNGNAAPAMHWGPELSSPDTGAAVTYSNPYQLAGESGRIYNFTRSLNFNPTFTFTDDSMTNWSAPRILIKTGNGRARPYVQYCSDYQRRIDFAYTDGHPLVSFTNSLYHAYYRDGAIHKTDGVILKRLADAPLLHDQGERGSLVYKYSPAPTTNPDDHIPGGRAWCWDMAYAGDTAPVTVFSVQRTNVMGGHWFDDRIYYYYARWTGSRWQKRCVANAGRPLYEGERDYAGGITLDPGNPDVIYLSSNAAQPFDLSDIDRVPLGPGEHYEIFRGVTRDGGRTFNWTAVTNKSDTDNLRPYVPRGNPFKIGLLWFSGKYTSYTRWQTVIYGRFDDSP